MNATHVYTDKQTRQVSNACDLAHSKYSQLMCLLLNSQRAHSVQLNEVHISGIIFI
jgi:hypothetical protein